MGTTGLKSVSILILCYMQPIAFQLIYPPAVFEITL
jgi:hypothetical protein